jgi:menaquinone-dependent protoporphyrinogen oxidase
MGLKILVTYATRTGSSAGVSSSIAQSLKESGADVDIHKMQDVFDLTAYDAIIAGSPVHSGKWLPEAMEFLQRHKDTLSKKPFATFMVCMTLSRSSSAKYRKRVSEWMKPVRDIAVPISEGYFAGKLEIKFIPSFINRLKFWLKHILRIWRQGDHRDWSAIKNWAKDTYQKIVAESSINV